MDKKTKKLMLTHLKEYQKYMAATKKSPNFQKQVRSNQQFGIVLEKKLKEIDYLIITIKELE